LVTARVRFDLFPQVRHTLLKFLCLPYAFPEGVGAIVEQSMKARVCELRARRDFRVFGIGAERFGCGHYRKDPKRQSPPPIFS